jgi:hypothetical protein
MTCLTSVRYELQGQDQINVSYAKLVKCDLSYIAGLSI